MGKMLWINWQQKIGVFEKTKSLKGTIANIKKVLIIETSFFQFLEIKKYDYINDNLVTNKSNRFYLNQYTPQEGK